jgi:hypothetical protein
MLMTNCFRLNHNTGKLLKFPPPVLKKRRLKMQKIRPGIMVKICNSSTGASIGRW